MEEKNLLLICASGITTGLLVRNMQQRAKANHLPINIYSAPSITVTQTLRDKHVDGVLIGPHLEADMKSLSILLEEKGIPYALIDQESYELLDSTQVLQKASEILKID